MGRDYYYRYFCKSICMNLRRMAVSAVNLTSAPRIVTNERIGEKKKERKKGKKRLVETVTAVNDDYERVRINCITCL